MLGERLLGRVQVVIDHAKACNKTRFSRQVSASNLVFSNSELRAEHHTEKQLTGRPLTTKRDLESPKEDALGVLDLHTSKDRHMRIHLHIPSAELPPENKRHTVQSGDA